MSKRFFAAAFAIGLACVGWVGLGFVGNNLLALAVTVLIGAVFTLGAWELRQYRAATASLQAALDGMNGSGTAFSALSDWLAQVPAGLRDAVRQRVEGERGVLPAPALTPYLVGLLVMLGMLGTFLGMVVTFKGAVFALEGSGDLAAMRAALAEPIKGLGLSFGTSVAGVATSALLGLMSTLARRERQEAARTLESCIAGCLRPFSRARQREAALDALQSQAGTLPAVVERLDSLMQRLEQRAQSLDTQLTERQDRFLQQAAQSYAQLGQRVGEALQDNLAAGARAASDTLRPVVEATMGQLLAQSQQLQQRLNEVAQAQVEQLSQRFDASARGMAQSWNDTQLALAQDLRAQWQQAAQDSANQQQALSLSLERATTETLTRAAAALAQLQDLQTLAAERLDALQQAATDGLSGLQSSTVEGLQQLQATAAEGLGALHTTAGEHLGTLQTTAADRLEALQATATDRLDALQATSAQHLATLGAALEAPMSRMMQTAAEVPQAAAGVIAQLREELVRMTERDNLALQERTTLLSQLQQLLAGLEQSSGAQAAAIDTLVTSTTNLLQQTADRQQQALQAQTAQATDLGEQARASAVELSALGESFAQGVQHFQESQDKLLEGLQRLETALARSQTRSDEQLAYYVAQAREVIDLSITSQQGLIEKLHQLREPGAASAQAALEGAA